MRILYASDIHTEFKRLERIPALPNPDTYDVVFLPGDIGLGMAGLEWILKTFPEDKHVYTLPGNHEYYRQNYSLLQTDFEQFAEDHADRLTILNPGSVDLGEFVLIGATLWSSLTLRGYTDPRITDAYFAGSIADFGVIRVNFDNGLEGYWSVQDHIKMHLLERTFIQKQLEAHADRRCVVMTHFVPTQLAIDPIYHNSPLNPYFTVDMDDLMMDYNVEAWFFGHTHSQYNKPHPCGTKLFCNPMGYPGENRDVSWKIVDLSAPV